METVTEGGLYECFSHTLHLPIQGARWTLIKEERLINQILAMCYSEIWHEEGCSTRARDSFSPEKHLQHFSPMKWKFTSCSSCLFASRRALQPDIFFWRGGRVLRDLTTEQRSHQHPERAGSGNKSRIPFTIWLLGTLVSNAELLISTGQAGIEKKLPKYSSLRGSSCERGKPRWNQNKDTERDCAFFNVRLQEPVEKPAELCPCSVCSLWMTGQHRFCIARHYCRFMLMTL